MQYIKTIISVFALAGLVASHTNFNPKAAKPDTTVDVVLNLPHSCEYKDGETWKVSKTNKVIIVYPEQLVKNNLLVITKDFKNSKKTEFKMLPESLLLNEVEKKTLNETSNNHHDHGHDHHDHGHDHHGHDHSHDHSHDHNDHSHDHSHDHSDHSHNNHDHSHDHHDHGHDHGHDPGHNHVHRRQEDNESPILGVTYDDFSEETVVISLSFKTPKLEQISRDVKALLFRVDQFCENGQIIRSIPGNKKNPPIKFEITVTGEPTQTIVNNSMKSSANKLVIVSLMAFTLPFLVLVN